MKSLAPKQPGMAKITVKTKRWFTAAAANDTGGEYAPDDHGRRRAVLHARGDQEDGLTTD